MGLRMMVNAEQLCAEHRNIATASGCPTVRRLDNIDDLLNELAV